ncbi:uncharacterized protein LOC134258181 [Saccostrea cucullata]|uniref:uncharacterized protein LOC134258181 n=1 Tax=Saccostrea cuccullata TaxID=36930 RepID=UPI002ED1975E
MDDMETLAREKNDEYASIIYPNTVIKGVGIVTGFSGNILVFSLYTFWIQNNEDSRYFIPFLAMVDALGSLTQGTFYLLADDGVKEEELSFRGQNFTGFVCRMVMEISSSTTIYVGFLFLLTLGNVIATAILYVPVCKTVYRAIKSMKKRKQTQNGSINMRQQSESIQETMLHNDDRLSKANGLSKNKTPTSTNGNSASTRISLMFLTVIAVYIISYIPGFIVVIINHTHKNFDPLQLSDAGLNTWRFFNTIFFFNHVCNPFIYWYYDKKIRRALANLCGKKN